MRRSIDEAAACPRTPNASGAVGAAQSTTTSAVSPFQRDAWLADIVSPSTPHSMGAGGAGAEDISGPVRVESRAPSLFLQPELLVNQGHEQKTATAAVGSRTLPQCTSPGAPSPATVRKGKLHRAFHMAKLQVNRDLAAFLSELHSLSPRDDEVSETIELVSEAAFNCMNEDEDSFKATIKERVDEMEDMRRSCTSMAAKQLFTRLLFILTRCSRLVVMEDSIESPPPSTLFLAHINGRYGWSNGTATTVKKHRTPNLVNKFVNRGARGLSTTSKRLVHIPSASPSRRKRLSSPLSRAHSVRDALQRLQLSDDSKTHQTHRPSPLSRRSSDFSGLGRRWDDCTVAESSPEQNDRMHSTPPTDGFKEERGPGGSLRVLIPSPTGTPPTVGTIPEVVVCRICENAVPQHSLEAHCAVCASLELVCPPEPDVDSMLTKLADIAEACDVACDVANDVASDASNNVTELIEVLIPCCRHAASLQLDGSEQPQQRCESLVQTLATLYSELEDHETDGEQHVNISSQKTICIPQVFGDSAEFEIKELLNAFFWRALNLIRRKSAELASHGVDDMGSVCDTTRTASLDSISSSSASSVWGAVSIDDFEVLKPISRGAYGRVYLARKKATGDLYAIKVMRKSDLMRKNMVQSARNERNILAMANNPFVVRFFYSFASKENLYIVMEYAPGGDLASLLSALGALEEDTARQYASEIALALEYCHAQGIIHRDLKPNNVLISTDGHVKLTDFGLSSFGVLDRTDPRIYTQNASISAPPSPIKQMVGPLVPEEKAQQAQRSGDSKDLMKGTDDERRAVGTPDYLAPELLLGTGHGPEADWWSLGVILYEMVVGVPPFSADTPEKIFQNILERSITWPPNDEISAELVDLINRLLDPDPMCRLGCKGAGELKRHPWFAGIRWSDLSRQKAVFVPEPSDDTDTSYFLSSKSVSARSFAMDLDLESTRSLASTTTTQVVGGSVGDFHARQSIHSTVDKQPSLTVDATVDAVINALRREEQEGPEQSRGGDGPWDEKRRDDDACLWAELDRPFKNVEALRSLSAASSPQRAERPPRASLRNLKGEDLSSRIRQLSRELE